MISEDGILTGNEGPIAVMKVRKKDEVRWETRTAVSRDKRVSASVKARCYMNGTESVLWW